MTLENTSSKSRPRPSPIRISAGPAPSSDSSASPKLIATTCRRSAKAYLRAWISLLGIQALFLLIPLHFKTGHLTLSLRQKIRVSTTSRRSTPLAAQAPSPILSTTCAGSESGFLSCCSVVLPGLGCALSRACRGRALLSISVTMALPIGAWSTGPPDAGRLLVRISLDLLHS